MRVNANVLLRNPQSGAVTVINAGEEVPGWATSLIGDHLADSEREPEARVSEETESDGDDEVDSESEVEVEQKKPTARRGRR